VEPRSIEILTSDPTIWTTFEQVGCTKFCKKCQFQGFHSQVAEQFTNNLQGMVKVGNIEFEVSKETISLATDIPLTGIY